jgi:hypothetical protein
LEIWLRHQSPHWPEVGNVVPASHAARIDKVAANSLGVAGDREASAAHVQTYSRWSQSRTRGSALDPEPSSRRPTGIQWGKKLMTTLRRLAVNTIEAVTRLASPVTQEWAQAIRRELDFIESDWAAFFWAVGSTKILFRRQAFRLADLSDIPRASQVLRRKIQLRTFAGSAVVLTEAAAFAWFTFANPHAIQRSGSALTVVAMLFWAYQLFSRRPRAVPSEPSACARSYRIELERQRDFFRGSWLWARVVVVIPGIALFCYGGIIADPGTKSVHLRLAVTFAALLLVAIPNSLRISRTFQRQLDDLEAVLREPEESRP